MRKFFCGLVLTVALVACGCELFFPPNPPYVFYDDVIESWKGRQIDEMLQFRHWRKWANGHQVKICPQDKECSGYPPNIAKLHILRRGGPVDGWNWQTLCKTTVAVDDKGKIISIAPGNDSACNDAMDIRLGYTSPGLAPGWIPYPPWPYPDRPYKASPWPYVEMIHSWRVFERHTIDELLEYGNWGRPTRVLKCPKECEALPSNPPGYIPNHVFDWDYKTLSKFHDISEIYVWRIVGHTKPPKLVLDDKVGYKDDYTSGSDNICLTEVYVSNKRKNDTVTYKKGTIVSIRGRGDFLGCYELIRHGVWSPKMAQDWYDPPP